MKDRRHSDESLNPGVSRRDDALVRSAGVGALGAGLASVSCCIVPFALLSLGAVGAWLGNLTALAPYQPYFAAAAILILGFGIWRIRRRDRSDCDANGAYCASPGARQFLRISLWVTTVLVIAGIGFNYLGQWLLST